MSDARDAEPIKVGFLIDYLSSGSDDWSTTRSPWTWCSVRATRRG